MEHFHSRLAYPPSPRPDSGTLRRPCLGERRKRGGAARRFHALASLSSPRCMERHLRSAAAAAAATTRNLCHFARLAAGRLGKTGSSPAASNSMSSPQAANRWVAGAGADPSTTGRAAIEEEGVAERRGERVPLADVVVDCVRRWFQDTLKEARAGDSAMQVLVGQMYYSGYGVPRNAQKGKAWISKASRNRPSAPKVGDKHPGYNVSESDSDELNDGAK